MEMLGPSLSGDVLMLDLDTVVLGLPEVPSETTVLQDFTHPELMGSGFMFVTDGDRARCWEAFTEDPDRHMRECSAWPKWGDQGFLQPLIGHSAKWGDEVRSYKMHCRRGVPSGTKVVCFHGQPRPWGVKPVGKDAWIPAL